MNVTKCHKESSVLLSQVFVDYFPFLVKNFFRQPWGFWKLSSCHDFADIHVFSTIVRKNSHYFDDIFESLSWTGMNTDVISTLAHKHCFWMKVHQFTQNPLIHIICSHSSITRHTQKTITKSSKSLNVAISKKRCLWHTYAFYGRIAR